jgi:hypothetical protein
MIIKPSLIQINKKRQCNNTQQLRSISSAIAFFPQIRSVTNWGLHTSYAA